MALVTVSLQDAGDVAIDPKTSNVYVVDKMTDRIEKFTADGKFLSQWGSKGAADGQFKHPEGIAIDSSGNIYVVDKDNNRVEKFDSNGKFIAKWGSLGSGNGQFNDGKGIAVDSAGRVYVSDKGNNNIQVFAPA